MMVARTESSGARWKEEKLAQATGAKTACRDKFVHNCPVIPESVSTSRPMTQGQTVDADIRN